MYLGIGLSVVGALLASPVGGYGLIALFPGCFALGIWMLHMRGFGYYCPRCERNLAPIVMVRQWHSVGGDLTHCRYCGAALDEEMPDEIDPISSDN